jgi:hypothetical protein
MMLWERQFYKLVIIMPVNFRERKVYE